MPSHSHIVPKVLNTHVLDTWASVAHLPSSEVFFRRATLCRPVITIRLATRIVAACLHIRPMCGGFNFARSTETACDEELHWSEPEPWGSLTDVLRSFTAQELALPHAMAA